MKFRFIYEGLSKKITFSILTIIQFTIGILCIYTSIELINDVNSSIDDINKYFGNGKYYKIEGSMVDKEIMPDDEAVERNIVILKEIKAYLDNNKNLDLLSARRDEVFVKKGEELNDAIVISDIINFQDTNYIRVQSFSANSKFLEKMNYKMLEGSIQGFSIEKDKDYIPVILGYAYKDKYKIGDKIETLRINERWEYEKGKMRVIGILTEDNYVYENGMLTEGQSLNNAILLPYTEFFRLDSSGNSKLKTLSTIELHNYLMAGYILLDDNDLLEKINEDLLKFQLKYQLKDLSKSMEEYKSSNMEKVKPLIYMAVIVILFSLISVVIVMINTIIKDKKDFGINIMMGATMADIRMRVLGQVFLLLGMSIVIATIILKSIQIFDFNIMVLFLTLGVMVVILMIISLIIILTLNKYSINDLIRRSE